MEEETLSLDEAIKFDGFSRCVLERLAKLIEKGYIPSWNHKDNDYSVVWLQHPKPSFKNRDAFLYASGMFLSGSSILEPEREVRIYLDQRQEFDAFLRTVPKSNWWDRGRETRAMLLTIAGFIVFGLIVSRIIKWIGSAF